MAVYRPLTDQDGNRLTDQRGAELLSAEPPPAVRVRVVKVPAAANVAEA